MQATTQKQLIMDLVKVYFSSVNQSSILDVMEELVAKGIDFKYQKCAGKNRSTFERIECFLPNNEIGVLGAEVEELEIIIKY